MSWVPRGETQAYMTAFQPSARLAGLGPRPAAHVCSPKVRHTTHAHLLMGLVLAAVCACTAYDPARDRKIPRPPKVVEWSHEASIAAPPEAVWAVLLDFDHYADWNPWIVSASGPAELGARVDIEVVLDGESRSMWHRITAVEAAKRFCWRDGGPTTAFATGLRCRELVDDGAGGTRFRVELTVGGSARRTVETRYGEQLQASMEAETEALATEVLRRASTSD